MNEFNNLLRPIAEVRGAVVSALLIIATYYLKEAMLFLPELGVALCVFFAASAIYYTLKAFRLYCYHRSLSSSVPYSLASHKIFKSESVYFMGKGYEWTAEHTLICLCFLTHITFSILSLRATKRERRPYTQSARGKAKTAF